MARSEITPASLVRNTAEAVTLDAYSTDGHYIDLSGAVNDTSLVIYCQQGSTSANWTVTVNNGTGFLASGLADITISATGTAIYALAVDSSRLKDASEYITIDVSVTGGTATGNIWAAYIGV